MTEEEESRKEKAVIGPIKLTPKEYEVIQKMRQGKFEKNAIHRYAQKVS